MKLTRVFSIYVFIMLVLTIGVFAQTNEPIEGNPVISFEEVFNGICIEDDDGQLYQSDAMVLECVNGQIIEYNKVSNNFGIGIARSQNDIASAFYENGGLEAQIINVADNQYFYGTLFVGDVTSQNSDTKRIISEYWPVPNQQSTLIATSDNIKDINYDGEVCAVTTPEGNFFVNRGCVYAVNDFGITQIDFDDETLRITCNGDISQFSLGVEQEGLYFIEDGSLNGVNGELIFHQGLYDALLESSNQDSFILRVSGFANPESEVEKYYYFNPGERTIYPYDGEVQFVEDAPVIASPTSSSSSNSGGSGGSSSSRGSVEIGSSGGVQEFVVKDIVFFLMGINSEEEKLARAFFLSSIGSTFGINVDISVREKPSDYDLFMYSSYGVAEEIMFYPQSFILGLFTS